MTKIVNPQCCCFLAHKLKGKPINFLFMFTCIYIVDNQAVIDLIYVVILEVVFQLNRLFKV